MANVLMQRHTEYKGTWNGPKKVRCVRKETKISEINGKEYVLGRGGEQSKVGSSIYKVLEA